MTDVDPEAILTALLDHARATGRFESVRLGEYKNAPPQALVFALWVEGLGTGIGSGLAATNAMMTMTARIYFPAFHKPESDVEIKVTGAASAFLGRINGGFTLDGTVRNIDLLGETGPLMAWKFGHAGIDNKISRIADLPIRVILNDAWEQGE